MNYPYSYYCKGCGVNFDCDLLPKEMRACPVCATLGTLQLAYDGDLFLCVCCGDAIPQSEVRNCPKCGGTMCRECWCDFDMCEECSEKQELMEQPYSGPVC